MKKIRILLALSAVVLAIGGAFATRTLSPSITVYEFSPPVNCIEHTADCATSGTTACTITGVSVQLRQDPTPSTSCGALMWKP
jgi:hypothetical protein